MMNHWMIIIFFFGKRPTRTFTEGDGLPHWWSIHRLDLKYLLRGVCTDLLSLLPLFTLCLAFGVTPTPYSEEDIPLTAPFDLPLYHLVCHQTTSSTFNFSLHFSLSLSLSDVVFLSSGNSTTSNQPSAGFSVVKLVVFFWAKFSMILLVSWIF